MPAVLITGATGFVGRALATSLVARGKEVRGTVRPGRSASLLPEGVAPVAVDPLGAETDWSGALDGVETVIHLAARVHLMKDAAADPLREFRTVNCAGTRRLAEQAARAGVRRLVFASSVKVHGEESSLPYREKTPPNPRDPYGASKWEAEQALREIERESGLEVVVLRPPLVYGPGVKANFLSLMRAVERGIPLPLGSIRNRRSMIYLGNLVDALRLCASHPAAAGRSYLVSDGRDLSTPELVRGLAAALGRPPRLLPLPERALRLAGRLAGRGAGVERLAGSLTVDISALLTELEWRPPFTVEEGLEATARWFREEGRRVVGKAQSGAGGKP